ncbi:MAG: GDSL-type esterase/lipase family protein, partial [Cyanobacteria bacterium P01_H01_bin.150]
MSFYTEKLAAMSNISKDKSFIGGIANQNFTGDAQFNAVNYAQATGGIIADLSTGIVTREFTPSIQNPLKILPLGDSITYGAVNTENENQPRDTESGGYRIFLNQFLINDALGEAVDFVGSLQNGPFDDNQHEGHSGRTIQYVSDRVIGWLNAAQPDMVLLMIGTNDTKSDTNPGGADERLSALIDKITNQSPNTHVLVASIPPIDPSLRQTQSNNAETYNAEIPGIIEEKIALGKKVTFVDVNAALTVNDINDGVHPSLPGYEKIANTWYDWIKSSQDTLINIDNLVGTAYNDELRGNAGNNIIEGGAGDDLMVGNQGEDTLCGGTGRDTFVLTAGQGTDTITDFSVNEDSLQLSGGLEFEQLSVIQGTGNNANDSWIIKDDNGEQLALLLGVQAATLLATETFNQNPVLANNNGLTLNEDAALSITSSQLQVTDADNTSSEITYQLTDTTDNGSLLLNGNQINLNNTF